MTLRGSRDRSGSRRNGGASRRPARLRDYYRVEDADGRRYWIYREGLIGDGRGGAPDWFIHGLFG